MAAKAPRKAPAAGPAKALSRRSKALTIVPVALLSGLWTASLVGTQATAAGTHDHHGSTLPDGTKVPTKAIEAPASVPVPGVIAPGVPDGTADSVVSGASTNGIPAPALAAYQRAAQVINTADKSCNIPWELIAAIGRVESDHGQYAGNSLTAKGIAVPGIYGPELNGRNGTQAIPDTDGGLVDHDKQWDRAVGPMQFIPSTWSVVKVDADGDGQRNPQDINDASLATAVYLCSGTENLSSRSGQEKAVYRYNHSQQYVDLVLRLMEAYSQGDYTAIPSGTSAGTLFTPDYAAVRAAHRQHVRHQHAVKARHSSPATGGGRSTSSGSTGGSSSSGPTGSTGAGTGDVPSAPTTNTSGGTLNDTIKKTVDGVTKTVTGGSTSSPSPSPATVTQTLSKTEATTKCLAQVNADSLSQLDLLGLLKQQAYNDCMAGYGY
jgi:membrane-bound lytic murein transglycosylase B